MDLAANADVFLCCLVNEHDRHWLPVSFILFLSGRSEWRWVCDEKHQSPFPSAGAAVQHCSLCLPEQAGRLHPGAAQAGEEFLLHDLLDVLTLFFFFLCCIVKLQAIGMEAYDTVAVGEV